jgi:hypothetical protein
MPLASSLIHPFHICMVITLQYCWGIYPFILKIVILIIEKGGPMFTLVVSICLLLLLALASSDLIVSNISPDELSNMGVEKKHNG